MVLQKILQLLMKIIYINPLLFFPVFLIYGLSRAFLLFLYLSFKTYDRKSSNERSVIPKAITRWHQGENNHFFYKTKKTKVVLHLVTANPELVTSDKPLMLFLHGFPECWYSWRSQLDYFGNDYKTIAVNMRGYAESDSPSSKSEYSADLLLADFDEIIEEYGNGRCILIGHDWGGALAWRYANVYPDKVSQLIILNAPHFKAFGKILAEVPEQFLMSWYIYFFQLPYLPEICVTFRDFAVLNFLYSPLTKKASVSSDDLDVYKYYFSKPGKLTAAINYYRANFLSKFKSDGKILAPTLLLWGCEDVALSEMCANQSYLSKYVENLTVIKNHNASHFLQQDDPKFVNEEIYKFINV